MKLKIINRAYSIDRDGFYIPIGESVLDAGGWDEFLRSPLAREGYIGLMLSTGALRAIPLREYPPSIADLPLSEARVLIGECDDVKVLKRWMRDLYSDEHRGKFKHRLSIVERMSYSGESFQWTQAEIDQLPRWRFEDVYRRLSDPEPRPIEPDRVMTDLMSKETRKRALKAEFDKKLAEIDRL